MFQAGKLDSVIQEMYNMNFDVLGSCETRWTGNGKIIHEDHLIIYSGGDDHRNGIGILMKKSVNASLIGFWPISDRVMMAKIKEQPFGINIIQAYAPTSDHSDDEADVFYEEMKQAMRYVKCGEVVIGMGDFNTKVGCGEHLDITGQFCLGCRNERGSRRLQFCEENNMMIANTYFQHQKCILYTCISPGDIYRNQIDFIRINKRFRNGVRQPRTYPGAEVGSDHNPLIIKMNIKLKTPKKKQINQQIELNLLKHDEYKIMYAVEVQNQYESLSKEETDQGSDLEVVDRTWQLLKTSMMQAAEKVLPKKDRVKRKSWMTNEIIQKSKTERNTKEQKSIKR